MNDVTSISETLYPTLFADDTTFSVSNNDYSSLVSNLNHELQIFNEWTVANRLTINVTKTELLIISNCKPDNSDHDIHLNNEFLKYSDTCSFLGVTLDNKLNFSNHIKSISSKLAKNTGIYYKIRENFTVEASLNFYYGFIFPFISYNIIVWGATYPTHLNPIIIQQKRFIRLMAGVERSAHTTPIFFKFKILKLLDVYRYFTLIYMFHALKKGIYTVRHDRATRNSDMASSSFHRLTLSQHCISFAGPKIWNEIPCYIRNIESLTLFKRKLKQYLVDQYS